MQRLWARKQRYFSNRPHPPRPHPNHRHGEGRAEPKVLSEVPAAQLLRELCLVESLAIQSVQTRCEMRNTFVLLSGLGVLAVVAVAQCQKGVKTQEDEQQLRKIEAETGELEQENDWSKMDLLADDWVMPGIVANVLSKKEFEDNVKRNFANHGHGPNPYTIEKKNMRVYLFADTAVVTYIKEYRQALDTTKFFDQDVIDVFARSPKGWLLHFTKTVPVSAERARD